MEFSIEPENFDALIDQTAHKLRDCFVAGLSSRDQVRERLALIEGQFNVFSTEIVKIAQVLDAELRSHLEDRTRRDHLHRHDVAWAPLSCRPRVGKVRG